MKPASLSILTGIMIGTSYIPFPPWAVFFCFVPLWIAWFKAERARDVFWLGWLAQFVLTFIGFNWVAHTVHEFGHLPWLVSIFVLGLFCGLANLYLPLAGLCWFLFCRKLRLNALGRLWLIPIFVCVFERIMPQIFDWHFGYTWLWAKLPGLHLADTIGFAGLSSLGILANGFLLWAWWRRENRQRSWVLIGAVTPFIFITLNIAGYFHGHACCTTDKTLRMLVVQANIGNQDKLAAETGWHYRDVVIRQFTDASRRGLKKEGPADFIIWPETAFPDLIENPHMDFGYPRLLRDFVLETHTPVITGGYARDSKHKITNSFFVIGANGEWEVPPYSKTMLLAFGEYFPGGEWFPRLYSLFPEVGNLGRGPGPTPMPLKDFVLGPQICYEGLFDWFARALANKGAQVIVNITNDSWYGTWEEPFQHGFMTFAKAVEVRRPLVRSTNTGLSGVALANGDILELSPLHREWFHLYEVPYAEKPETTVFMTYGYWLIPALLLLALIFIPLVSRERA